MLGIGLGLNKLRSSGLSNILLGAMVWGFKSKFKWSQTSTDIWGFANPNDIDPESQVVYNRIIADGGVSDLTRLNFFVKGLKTIYGDLTNVPVCYDAHWIGYKLGSGTGATAGQAAAKLYSLTVAGDAVQTTAASQPLLLAHSGSNYYKGVAVAGNSCIAPKALTQTDTLDFIMKLDLIDGAVFSGYAIGTLDNSTTSRQFYAFYSGGSFGLSYGNGFPHVAFATTATSRYNGWLRITLEKSGANSLVKFYKSEETSITNPSLVTWTQIGSTITGTYAAMATTTTDFNILSGGLSSNCSNAKCYYAHISETIGGSPLAVFNPATYNAATSQTQWTSATGEIWTISTGTATTGYKGVLVDRTIVQGDGVDDSMTSGTLASANYFSSYIALNPKKFDASKYIIDGSSNDNHYIYNGSSVIKFGEIPYVGGAQNVLNLYSGDFNNTNTKIRLNNTNEQSGIFVTVPTTSVKLFSRSNGLLSSNTNINTLIFSASIDTDTTKTATYNLIRSLNNNAF
jgi:hypothetical protein